MNAEVTAQSSKPNQHRSSTQSNGQPASAGWQPNIGKVDRYIRLASGLFLMSSSASSRNSSLASRALLLLGAMKVTEGILGWCPVMELFGIKDTRGVVESQQSTGKQDSADRQDSATANPTTNTNTNHGNHDMAHDQRKRPLQFGQGYTQKEPSDRQDSELQTWNQMADSSDKSERDEVVAAMNTSFQ